MYHFLCRHLTPDNMKVSLKLKDIQVMERLQRRTKKKVIMPKSLSMNGRDGPQGYFYKKCFYTLFFTVITGGLSSRLEKKPTINS